MDGEIKEIKNKGNKGIKIALGAVLILFSVILIVNVYIHIKYPYGITTDENCLKTPKIKTDLQATDNNTLNGPNYLQISGSARNIGGATAYNCRLHVILYQGKTVAEDTFIDLGSIDLETSVEIDEKIYYEGSDLTNWTITPLYPVRAGEE